MTQDIADAVKAAINKKLEDEQEDGRRAHLGYSLIGRECSREIWYSWRWANPEKFEGRMLRLFERGHLEEYRFIKWLEGVSDEVWAVDPRTGDQIRVSDFKGYAGGSMDGVVRNPAGYKGDYLCEFKTHNDKSFKKLNLQGVKDAKPEHYTQMQMYLHYMPKLSGALYFAINKNDDDLYIEFVHKNEAHAKVNLEKAASILLSTQPVERFEGASEYNFYCNRFCAFASQCWRNVAPAVSCRTCRYVLTTDEGWKCDKHGKMLDVNEQKNGCENYERAF